MKRLTNWLNVNHHYKAGKVKYINNHPHIVEVKYRESGKDRIALFGEIQ